LFGLDGADSEYLPSYFPEFKVKQVESPVPLSGPAWTSLYTGKTMKEHGVTHIWGLKVGNSKRLSDIPYKTFWEKLQVEVGIFNAPVTYPPRPVNGFILSGFPIALDNKPISYPENIVDEDYWKNKIMDIAQYGGLSKDRSSWRQQFTQREKTKAITEQMSNRQIELLEKLLGTYPDTRFLFAQFSHIDRLFHLWGVNQENVKYVYREAMRLLNAVKRAYNPDRTFIVSDHGFLRFKGHGDRRVAVFAHDKEPKLMPRKITDIHNTILGEY